MAVDDEPELFVAIRKNDEEAVRVAAAQSIDVAKGQKSALALATCLGHAALVKLLLELGATDTMPPSPAWSAAMHASFRGRVDVLAELIAHDVEATVAADAQQLRPLHLACMKGHTACVDALLDAAPQTINEPDAHGRTALMLAAGSTDPELLTLLAKRGAAVDATSSDGKTALHWAIVSHQPKAVEALVQLGADIDARDLPPAEPIYRPGKKMDEGNTPMDMANDRHGKDAVFKFIHKYLKGVKRAREAGAEPPPMGAVPWIARAQEVAEAQAAQAAQAAALPAHEATPAPAKPVESDIFDDAEPPPEETGAQPITDGEAVQGTDASVTQAGELDELD